MRPRNTARRVLKGGLIAFFLACLAGLAIIAMLPVQPPKPTTATVTAITNRPAEYRRVVDITIRSSDGLVGREIVAAAEVGCAVGDVVRAERVGVSLRLAPGACRTKARLP